MNLDDIMAGMRGTRTVLNLAAPPSQPGVYALFLAKHAILNQVPTQPESVIYIGRSSNLARRLMNHHFRPGASGSSTLRRSLGAVLKDVLGLRAVQRGKEKSARNYTNYCFSADSEERLMQWMNANLEISFYATKDFAAVEAQLVQRLAPVLNIEHSANPYTPELKRLRAVCLAEARHSTPMLIRCFWRNCNFRGKQWGVEPLDAFWVEATQADAETCVFPRLQPAAIAESRKLVAEFKRLAGKQGNPARPFCFLAARDLSSINPFPPDYPIHQLWNAYSPFESMSELVIASLDELRNLDLPARGPA